MSLVTLHVHHSQFPDAVRAELLNSLRTRQVNHKFHYDSVKQANKWLALHAAYSPARTDPECVRLYENSFRESCQTIGEKRLSLIGLGCGGGQKEAQLVQVLQANGKHLDVLAVDVSSALVVTSENTINQHLAGGPCQGLVCDLEIADDLPQVFDRLVGKEARRIVTFFGLIPNFEPDQILPKLAAMLRPDDVLFFSANLAPGPDYAKGVEKILPLYQNELTADWLRTFLFDLGVEAGDGELKFGIMDVGSLKRIEANYLFNRSRTIQFYGETFQFAAGDSIRLFFSYRHTSTTVRELLAKVDIDVLNEWITPSGEEGVFLCRKQRQEKPL